MRERVAGRDVDRVGAGVLEPAARPGLRPRPCCRACSHGRNALPSSRRADLHLEVEVVADLVADRADGLEQQPRTVLERAAVVVLAVVDRRGQELREEVAVGAVDLDAVEAGLARAARAGGELRRSPRAAARATRAPPRSRSAGRACPSSSGRSGTRSPGCRAAGRRARAGGCTCSRARARASPSCAPERDAVVAVDRRVVRGRSSRAGRRRTTTRSTRRRRRART